jgi:coenzyme F420-reducing hydrogenase delta subunit
VSTKITEIRRSLRAAGADGVLVVIDQHHEPERTVGSYKVDNRITRVRR